MSSAACTVPFKFAQWIYFVSFVLSAVASWLLRDFGAGSAALNFSPLNDCVNETDPPNPSCTGAQAVLAISFGSFCFFSLHALLLLGVTSADNPRLVLFTGFWPIKLLLWGGACFGFFYVPASALQGFGEAARVFSGIFIVLQLLILLEFFYSVNEWLVERDQCAWALVAGSAFLIVGAFVGIGFLYHFYAPVASCSLNIWFITSMILMFLLYAGISISPLRNDSAGLFISACVFAYTVYFCWSALNAEPLSHACASASAGSNKVIQVVGFVLALLALGWTAVSSATSSQAFDLSTGSACDGELPHRPDFFCAMFALAACYMGVIFVGWDLSGAQGDWSVDRGWGSTWVKIAAAWLCGVLYTWSLVAHRVLKDRTF